MVVEKNFEILALPLSRGCSASELLDVLVFLFIYTAGTPKQRSYPNIRFRKMVHSAGFEPAWGIYTLRLKRPLFSAGLNDECEIGRSSRNRTRTKSFGDFQATITPYSYNKLFSNCPFNAILLHSILLLPYR